VAAETLATDDESTVPAFSSVTAVAFRQRDGTRVLLDSKLLASGMQLVPKLAVDGCFAYLLKLVLG
jgi:hypothetical protein